jgi:Zn-finger nucleic acid-binding protein
MQCPVDGTELAMADREGVEFDYCPKCRGVRLDRGELDKIIERTEGRYGDQGRHGDDDHEPDKQGWGRGRRRRFREFFDFGD